MRTLFKTGAIAIAALASASAAQAAVVVTYPNGQTVNLTTNDGLTYSGQFRASVSSLAIGDPAFTGTFNFTVPGKGSVAIAAISIAASAASNINFTSGLLDGTTPFTITNGAVDIASLGSVAITSGLHSFTLNGVLNPPSGQGNGGFGGDVSFTLAVPEPATWALFIIGFGMVGGTMRRRTAKAQSVRAQLTLA